MGAFDHYEGVNVELIAAVVERGVPRCVTATELQRNWKELAASIADRERIVITKHGRPQAIVFGLRDVVELMIDAEQRQIESLAAQDWESGRAVQLMPDEHPRKIFLSRLAAGSIDAQGRSMLSKIMRRELRRVKSEEESPLWLRGIDGGGRWLIPFSQVFCHDGAEAILAHDVIDAWEIEKELIGLTLHAGRSRREAVSLQHCRDPGPPPLAAKRLRSAPSGPRPRPSSGTS